MDKKQARLAQMLEILRQVHTITISAMAQHLCCSEMTIRRALKDIPSSFPMKLLNGVIVYDNQLDTAQDDIAYEVGLETIRHNVEKERIGRFAATLIDPEDIIIIDGGTTTEKMISHIDESKNITALCYNYNILMELYKKPGISLVMAGGYYHPNTSMFESASGIQLIREIRANKVFLSCAGIHQRLGLTNAQRHEVATVQAAIASSLCRILLADSSKFDQVRPAYTAHLSDIDIIITDNALSSEWREIISNAGITLHIV